MTPLRTIVLYKPEPIAKSQDAQELFSRLSKQPGVVWVRIDAAPCCCVTLRIDPALANQAALRALVLEHDASARTNAAHDAAGSADRPAGTQDSEHVICEPVLA